MRCTMEQRSARRALSHGHMERLIAAPRDSSRSRVTGLLFNTPLTYISLLGQRRRGCREPWANVSYSWRADSAVLLSGSPTQLQLRFYTGNE
ncbi:hypothetical protein Nmel_001437 [Mimus melanotis]